MSRSRTVSAVRPARQPGAGRVNAKQRSHRQGTARTMVTAAATSQHRVNCHKLIPEPQPAWGVVRDDLAAPVTRHQYSEAGAQLLGWRGDGHLRHA